jgi:hypothetical protein
VGQICKISQTPGGCVEQQKLWILSAGRDDVGRRTAAEGFGRLAFFQRRTCAAAKSKYPLPSLAPIGGVRVKTEQRTWSQERGWNVSCAHRLGDLATLVLAFGVRELLPGSSALKEVRNAYPNAQIVGCSTAGTIAGTHVSDDFLAITAVSFEHTAVRAAEATLWDAADSATCGKRLITALQADDLAHVLVLSDGLNVNGGELVRGLVDALPPHVAVTGGLSGDGARFKQTLVYHNGEVSDHRVVAVGFYGKRLRVGYGSLGGWDPFGPKRIITRSRANVLYELDGESALGLYRRYLGAHAAGLPASGLRFPLSIESSESCTPVVRTILGIDEKEQSLTFAGDVPQGSHARLMRANFDRLIDGATGAARATQGTIGKNTADLALLISCVGRKLILQQRTEEEVEAVRAVLGERPTMTGFYSYGEIAPFTQAKKCDLHNQTMTITTFSEAA